MNRLSLNLCGTRTLSKRNWVRSNCVQHGVSFFCIQETRMSQLNLFRVRSVWGKNTFDYVFSNAHGREEFYLFGTPMFFLNIVLFLLIMWLSLVACGFCLI